MLLSQSAFANQCSELFGSKNQAKIDYNESLIDDLILVENRVNHVDSLKRALVKSTDLIHKIDHHLLQTRVIIESLLDSAQVQHEIKKQIDILNSSLDKIEQILRVQKARKENTDFSQVLLTPEILRAEYLYEVNGMDPLVKRVLFSEKVAKEIFWSENQLYKRASELILRGIIRGKKYAIDSAGIIPFSNDKSVFKVKITGTAVGAIRVAGYFKGTDFYIVDFLTESNHGEHSSNKITTHVNQIRKTRGH